MVPEVDNSDQWRIAEVEKIFGHVFSNKTLPIRALTRVAYAKEQKDMDRECENQEVLATLGDAVLKLFLSEFLLKLGYRTSEEITIKRKELEEEKSLAEIGQNQGIGRLLILGHGEENQEIGENPGVLAETLEALIGAVYLDSNFEACKKIIPKFFENR